MTYKPLPPKADPEQAGRARTPRIENVLGFLFLNFNGETRIYFFSQYTMFTICILFTTLTKKR